MATKVSLPTLQAYVAANSDFQGWVTAIHNALSTLGLTQTADTGQINPATVNAPSPSAAAGYEVWRFNDTLQSSVPVFIKIEYGMGSSTGVPMLWFTVGSGSNGSGTLTGQVGQRQQIGSSSPKSAGVTLPAWLCSDGSDLIVAYGIDAAASNAGAVICISRPRDATGAPTADGVVWFSMATVTNSPAVQFIPPSGTVPAAVTGAIPAVNPTFMARSISGSNAVVCPLMIPLLGGWRYLRFLITGPTDFGTGGATFTVTLFGSSHTFVALGQAVGAPGGVIPAGAGVVPGFAVAFE